MHIVILGWYDSLNSEIMFLNVFKCVSLYTTHAYDYASIWLFMSFSCTIDFIYYTLYVSLYTLCHMLVHVSSYMIANWFLTCYSPWCMIATIIMLPYKSHVGSQYVSSSDLCASHMLVHVIQANYYASSC